MKLTDQITFFENTFNIFLFILCTFTLLFNKDLIDQRPLPQRNQHVAISKKLFTIFRRHGCNIPSAYWV